MKTKRYIYGLLAALLSAIVGCSKTNHASDPDNWNTGPSTPRLIVQGTVTNTANEPLQGISIAIFGVRLPDERDILSYNYALTDSAGRYFISRYRGRDIPTEVTVVATDSSGVYQEQLRFATATYDSIYMPGGWQICNAYATADFVLSPQ